MAGPCAVEAAEGGAFDGDRGGRGGCQHIAETIEGHRIPAVRMQTLLRLLERRFGCEVGSGKGSEVTVYRPGGRKFTLGHHTRNTHVPAHVVRALLKAVGIAVTEWWRTCAA